ncbi:MULTISPECIES: Ig-like domain-containing protein [Lysinibacillus]|uniref:Ig-like domain-containing protein n=1 Tax=Lysinibacillus TaxID=400634 RepID=UPI0021A2D734|nr:Ig-like domain-containing protein [Lysinibacillus capsici]MCT1538383.1 Ig-like domain-containing protein [Lysinibacillus capsici]MCT1569091.1 Ig-like domain-containing protein [Lysinibacillus capsici]MCT1646106.1 Ig-like domain-containing protein [Lysinibacillus capsici]MCT1725388.1 Ig-like domain-containing protein [Lysinibacillus capsici]MCT1784168.1 Ig-like domain-containing protein [Lysinibacillus capsici]
MVQYYYVKYNVVSTPTYSYNVAWSASSNSGYTSASGYTSYSIDGSGKIVLGGSYLTIQQYTSYGTVYTESGSALIRHTIGSHDNVIYETWGSVQKTQTGTTYSRGSLVQSNIVAEDGTYPANGRHTDGYWYVKGTVVNTAPTMPGAFTQPSGNLEIGDSKVFAVGTASDAEGNLSKYIWEASINGGAFSKVGETTANSLTYTIPTATSLKMRVKAVDSAGLESSYRESSLYTVQPPQYYYDKYNVDAKRTYQDTAPWEYVYDEDVTPALLRKAYGFNPATNKYFLGELWGDNVSITDQALIYNYAFDGSYVARYQLPSFSGTGNTSNRYTGTKVYLKYASKNTYTTQDVRGSLVQNGIIGGATAYPIDGKHTDGFWYVRKSRVNQSIAPPKPFTSPTTGKKFKPNEVATITFGASNASNLSLYEVDYRYNTTGAWTPLPYNNTLTRSLTITTDKTLKTLELRVRAKDTNNVYSDYVYSEVFEIEHNVAPTVSLTGPGENTTLYENDTFTIAGTAYDDDADQSVTVYYQINSEQRKVLATNLSKTQITLSKQLTFKGGKLFDGEVVLTDTLAEGVPHTLKVWAVDNEGAQSATIERTFYVVPNRAPLLAIDAVVPSGIINTDKFKISGTASDQDANSNIKVNYRINGANPVEVYNGAGGAWEFEVSLAQLVVNENTIIIEVIDNYDAKTSKTIKLNKNELKTPILQSVARYKISPPKGSARGVLIWVQRDEELDLKVELSMTLVGEQEQYILLEADPDNIVPVTDGIVEDEYYHETVEPKDNIILKLTTTRPNINIDNNVYLIMGVVE